MSFRRCLEAATLVSTLSLLGCAETTSIDDLDEPDVTPKGGSGAQSGGTNGGSSDDHNRLEWRLIQATNFPLVNPGTNVVHPGIGFNLLTQPGGPGLFKYAVQCALAPQPGMEELTWFFKSYPTRGHLTTTDGWRAGPLTGSAREDLFACMATLMNPSGVHVDIVIEGGGQVRDDNLDHSEFTFMEAAWAAQVIGGSVYYTVWPTDKFVETCEGDIAEDVFEERICGKSPVVCRYMPGGRLEDHCERDSAGWFHCDGRRALVTYLRPEDVLTLNPTCAPSANP